MGTLLGQGLTLAPLLRRLHLEPDHTARLEQQAAARHAAVDAALRRLDQLQRRTQAPADLMEQLCAAAHARQQLGWEELIAQAVAEATPGGEGGALDPQHTPATVQQQLRQAMIAAEREELLSWRDTGRLDEESMRELERELDLEEATLSANPRDAPATRC